MWWLSVAALAAPCFTSLAKEPPIELADGASITFIQAHDNPVLRVQYSHDGERLVSSDAKGRVELRRTDNLELEHAYDFTRVVGAMVFDEREAGLWVGTASIPPQVAAINLNTRRKIAFEVRALGGIHHLRIREDGRELMYVTSDHKIRLWDLARHRLMGEQQLFGGFLGTIASSPDGRWIAISSENEVDDKSAPPQKLLVYDGHGKSTAVHEYGNRWRYTASRHTFIDSNTLVLCLPRIPDPKLRQIEDLPAAIKRWSWSEAAGDWRALDDVRLDLEGIITAIAYSPQHRYVWVSVGEPAEHSDRIDLYALEPCTREVRRRWTIPGLQATESPLRPVTAMAASPKKKQVVLGCGDGRLAVINYE